MKTTAYPIQLSASFAWYLAKNQIRGTKQISDHFNAGAIIQMQLEM